MISEHALWFAMLDGDAEAATSIVTNHMQQIDKLMELSVDMILCICVIHKVTDKERIHTISMYILDMIPDFEEEHHDCQKEGDHAEFLSKMLLWIRDEVEIALGVRERA